jgi:hypothetical protein
VHPPTRLTAPRGAASFRILPSALDFCVGWNFAHNTGSWVQVARWRKGDKPNALYLYRLSIRFGVTLDWLVGVRGAPMYRHDYPTGQSVADAVEEFVAEELTRDPELSRVTGVPMDPYVELSGSRMLASLVASAREDRETWRQWVANLYGTFASRAAANWLKRAPATGESGQSDSRAAEGRTRYLLAAMILAQGLRRPRLKCYEESRV